MKVYQVPLHNQRYEPNKADLIPRCEHISFGYCGDCRAKEKELEQAAQEEVIKLRAELAALHAIKAALTPAAPAFQSAIQVVPLRLDLGCGNSTRRAITGLTKEKGWTGVDLQGTEGADVHTDLAAAPWPWPDNSVDEVHCAHMLEHVPAKEVEWALEIAPPMCTVSYSGGMPAPLQRLVKKVSYPRVHFFNELHRVLKPGAKATVIVPHWCSCRAYGDVTHEWPPVSEMFWAYLDKQWRTANAPHVGFACDFAVGYGYITAAWLQGRNSEYVSLAVQTMKEAAQDMQATLTARK